MVVVVVLEGRGKIFVPSDQLRSSPEPVNTHTRVNTNTDNKKVSYKNLWHTGIKRTQKQKPESETYFSQFPTQNKINEKNFPEKTQEKKRQESYFFSLPSQFFFKIWKISLQIPMFSIFKTFQAEQF